MTNALATIVSTDYPALLEDSTDILQMITDNLEGETISPFDLDTVKVPGSAGLTWELPGDQSGKTFDAIVISHKLGRQYWSQPYGDGEGGPPDCHSTDTIIGVGTPGGECSACEYAEFGSALKGAGQACGMRRTCFLLMPGAAMPTVISVPPSSLKGSKKYFFNLGNQGHRYFHVVTRFSLEKTKASGGIDYSKIVFEMVGPIPEEMRPAVEAYRQLINGDMAAPKEAVTG